MARWHMIGALCWLLAGCTPPAVTQDVAPPGLAPPGRPFLRLESGGHTAVIRRIAVDAAGRYLVSASEDKTARVWDAATGELLQILRPPLDNGHEGKLYAVALSPDGATVALGGWTKAGQSSHNIYLFDRTDGRLLHRLTGLPDTIHDLAFSHDGRYLAAALDGANGIRVYRSDTWQEVFRDSDYGAASYSVEFAGDGRLLTTADDGYLRLYKTPFHLAAKRTAPGGKQPYSARFSPNGSRIAVGFRNPSAVNLLSGRDLAFISAPDTNHARAAGDIHVAWSTDGNRLLAGGVKTTYGSYGNEKIDRYRIQLLSWSTSGQGPAQVWGE